MKRLFTLFRLLDSGRFCWRLWSWLFWGFLIGVMGIASTVIDKTSLLGTLVFLNADYVLMLVFALYISIYYFRSRLLATGVLSNFLMLPMSRRKKRFLLLLRTVLLPWFFLCVSLLLFGIFMPADLTRAGFNNNFFNIALLSLACGVWLAEGGLSGNWVSVPESQNIMTTSVRYEKKLHHFKALAVVIVSLFLLMLPPYLMLIAFAVLFIFGLSEYFSVRNELYSFPGQQKINKEQRRQGNASEFKGLGTFARLYRMVSQETRTGPRRLLVIGTQYVLILLAFVFYLMVQWDIVAGEGAVGFYSTLCGILWSGFWLLVQTVKSLVYPWQLLILQPVHKWQKWFVLSMLTLGSPLLKVLVSIPVAGVVSYFFISFTIKTEAPPAFYPIFIQTLSAALFSIPYFLLFIYAARGISWLVQGLFLKRKSKPSFYVSFIFHIMLFNIFTGIIAEESVDFALIMSSPVIILSVLCSLLFLGMKYMNISRSWGAPS